MRLRCLFLAIVLLLYAIESTSQTEVDGDVSGEWIVDDAPYIVIEDIRLPRNEALTIEPGVNVLFDRLCSFQVEGRLIAEGTEDDSIFFDWNQEDSRWRGLRMINADDESIISYCVFQHSERIGDWQNPESRGGALYLERTEIVNSLEHSPEHCSASR